jgi:hypothetical protein
MHSVAALFVILASSAAKSVVQLQVTNFEMAISSYRFLAVNFHDAGDENGSNKASERLSSEWHAAAGLLPDMGADIEMAQINSSDPNIDELMSSFGITIPTIKIFRKGAISSWGGPRDSVGIASHIELEVRPSVTLLPTREAAFAALSSSSESRTILVGIFPTDDEDCESTEGAYPGTAAAAARGGESAMSAEMSEASDEAWEHFQSTADSLRTACRFLATRSPQVAALLMESAQRSRGGAFVGAEEPLEEEVGAPLDGQDTDPRLLQPRVFLIPPNGDGMLEFPGQILEFSLSEFVLRNTLPPVGELSFSSDDGGEAFVAQFFSTRRLKFILCATAAQLDSELSGDNGDGDGDGDDPDDKVSVLQHFMQLRRQFAGLAFAYMRESLVDVHECVYASSCLFCPRG